MAGGWVGGRVGALLRVGGGGADGQAGARLLLRGCPDDANLLGGGLMLSIRLISCWGRGLMRACAIPVLLRLVLPLVLPPRLRQPVCSLPRGRAMAMLCRPNDSGPAADERPELEPCTPWQPWRSLSPRVSHAGLGSRTWPNGLAPDMAHFGEVPDQLGALHAARTACAARPPTRCRDHAPGRCDAGCRRRRWRRSSCSPPRRRWSLRRSGPGR